MTDYSYLGVFVCRPVKVKITPIVSVGHPKTGGFVHFGKHCRVIGEQVGSYIHIETRESFGMDGVES